MQLKPYLPDIVALLQPLWPAHLAVRSDILALRAADPFTPTKPSRWKALRAIEQRLRVRLLGGLAAEQRRLVQLVERALYERIPTHGSVLFLVPYAIADEASGGAARLIGLARQLAVWYRVDMIMLGAHGVRPISYPIAPGLWLHQAPKTTAFCRRIEGYRTDYQDMAQAVALDRHFGELPALASWVEMLGRRAKFIAIDGPPLVRAARTLCPDAHLVFEAANVYSDYISAIMNSLEASVRSAVVQEAHRMEEAGLSMCDRMWYVSERDRASFAGQYPHVKMPTHFIPSGMDVDEVIWSPPDQSTRLKKRLDVEGDLVLFMGTQHKPNIEAVSFMADVLARTLPRVHFVIMGMTQAGFSARSPSPIPANLEFLGQLSPVEKEAAMAVADVVVNPIVSGSGSSLKIPDYLAHGKPLLTTRFGLRGYEDLKGEVHLSEMAEFPAALRDLLARVAALDPAVLHGCEAAKAMVAERYDWRSIGRNLFQVMEAAHERE